ncbi:hypothetical protein [Wolbachia endosymbiont of Carposina sasakii]|nr:hypothetical protein [Wolbachia endosymbiont of Carposina sasakii]
MHLNLSSKYRPAAKEEILKRDVARGNELKLSNQRYSTLPN